VRWRRSTATREAGHREPLRDRPAALKHIFGLSDEGVCERWVYDPYFQHLTGETFFQHSFPHERSDLSHWRKRLGERLDLLLAESLRVAHASGALRTRDLARITVDTTVQPKNIAFPTDAKLLHAAIKGLNRLARPHTVRLRHSYLRVAKQAAMMAGRYAHAKQFNRHHRQVRFLRTRLGRLIRDIRSKIALAGLPDPIPTPARLEALFLPCTGSRVHRQGQGPCALRVRRQGLDRHHQRLCPGGPVRAAGQGTAGQSLRRPHFADRPQGHPAPHRTRDSTGLSR
jgi:Transposase domain (DUF772)